MTIQAFAAERKIQLLLHFTRLENLDSILANGLYTKGECNARRIIPVTNDAYRLDYTEAICLSVSFPNYKLFYPLRVNNPEAKWAVVALKASVLWEKNCAFCRENAAKSAVASIPIEQRKSVAALRAMFDDFENKPRASLNLPTHMPTNPQAEILVFSHIEPNYIIGVAFNDIKLMKRYSSSNSLYRFKNIPKFFNARQDYAHWK
jgi:ssDNA thymidine ADP-ribosyltransferase, DarT